MVEWRFLFCCVRVVRKIPVKAKGPYMNINTFWRDSDSSQLTALSDVNTCWSRMKDFPLIELFHFCNLPMTYKVAIHGISVQIVSKDLRINLTMNLTPQNKYLRGILLAIAKGHRKTARRNSKMPLLFLNVHLELSCFLHAQESTRTYAWLSIYLELSANPNPINIAYVHSLFHIPQWLK